MARFSSWRTEFAAVLLVAATASGCASLGALEEPPMVSISAVESVEPVGLEQRYRLRLRVKNPGRKALSVEGLSFRLFLNGETFADGVSPANVTIEPFSEAVLDVEATSNLYRIYRQAVMLPDRGARPLEWRIEGNLSVQGRLSRVPFEAAGELGPVPASQTP